MITSFVRYAARLYGAAVNPSPPHEDYASGKSHICLCQVRDTGHDFCRPIRGWLKRSLHSRSRHQVLHYAFPVWEIFCSEMDVLALEPINAALGAVINNEVAAQ